MALFSTKNARMIGLVFVIVMAASTVHAVPPSAVTQAKASYERGKNHLEKAHYAEALEEFHTGYKLSGRPLFLFNIAECLRFMGDLAGSRSFYLRYLQEDPKGPMAQESERRLASLPEVPDEEEGDVSHEPITPSKVRLAPEAVTTPAPKPAVDLRGATPASRPRKTWPIWVGVTLGLVAAAAVVTGAVLGTQGGSSALVADWRR